MPITMPQSEKDRRIGELMRQRRSVQDRRDNARREVDERLDALKNGTSLIFDVHPLPRLSVSGGSLMLGDIAKAVTWPSWEQVRDAARQLQDAEQELTGIAQQLSNLGA